VDARGHRPGKSLHAVHWKEGMLRKPHTQREVTWRIHIWTGRMTGQNF